MHHRDAVSGNRREVRFAGLLLGLCLAGMAAVAAPPVAGPMFEKDVRPILKAHCFDCHGEASPPKGGLDLRLRRWILKGGSEGAAIVPGRPDESRLLRMVEHGEMPKREKKVPAEQVAVLRRWIATGAPTARPEPESLPAGAGITEEERAFWSFQPLQPPRAGKPSRLTGTRTAVDVLLRGPLRKAGLRFSPEADRLSLIRRVTFDLTGLPPTPEEVDAFVSDRSPEAYERLVDRLLDSPHYGERWGRHWLDVAGYADSDGYTDADPVREHAWKYRDYVIRSFNADKPFDRFLTEQLAGDELVGAHAGNANAVAVGSEADRELLVATGFLRMAADGSMASGVDPAVVRNQVVADTLKIVSTSLLGLSVGCAQCHDHRYDPIPQADYYRLRAVFEPAYDWKQWRTPGQRLVSLYTEDDRKKAAEAEAEASRISAEREAKQKEFIAAALAKHLEKFDEALRPRLKEAFETPADKRTPEQKKLLADHPSVNIHPGVLYQYDPKAADALKALDAKIAEARGRRPKEDFIAALTEVSGQVPETRLFHRGDPARARDVIGPGGLSVLGSGGLPVEFPSRGAGLPTTGRRLAFARWLTGGTNPLVARVLVNRVWMHHFGRGLVGTPADFGAMGEKPSHPELLDWLADDFVRNGWRLKRLHRLIVTSNAYRQTSARNARGDARDPDNRLYWRRPVVRLDAEAVRDAMLSVSGSLRTNLYGPPVPVRPDVHGQVVVGVDRTEGDNKMPVDVPLNGEEFRRSVYVQVRRSRPLAFLHAFDAPVMEVNCERRPQSTVATQALMLMNSGFVLDQSARFARRVTEEAGADPARQVDRAWRLAYQRLPRPDERAEAVAFLQSQAAHFRGLPPEPEPKPAKEGKPSPKPAPEERALTNLCQALLGSNEFLYVD